MGLYAGVDYITSPYVHSRVDSNTFTMGNPYARVDLNPIPESTLSPQSQGLDLASDPSPLALSLCALEKNVSGFPVPSRDVTYQTLPGREYFNYSRPGRVWSVISRLETGNPLTFFLQCVT